MPNYKYKCPICRTEIELNRTIERRDDNLVCLDKCHRRRRKVFLERIPTPVALSGFDKYGRS
jgi:predicted nucleic acid-binding Zn ribbon protein